MICTLVAWERYAGLLGIKPKPLDGVAVRVEETKGLFRVETLVKKVQT